MTKAELLEAAAKRLAEIVILLEAAGEQEWALGAEDLQHQVESPRLNKNKKGAEVGKRRRTPTPALSGPQ